MSTRYPWRAFLFALLLVLVSSAHHANATPPAQDENPEKSADTRRDASIVIDGITAVLARTDAIAAPAGSAAIVMSEDFEGAWPAAGWEVLDDGSSDGGEYLWSKRDCHPRMGNFAGWSVGGGAQGSALTCSGNYPNNVRSWALYGPFDLSGATTASLSFHFWGRTEAGQGCPYDLLFVGSSTDGTDFQGSGYCGNWTDGYHQRVFDLGDRLGHSQVWVGFGLISDGSITYNGITIDNVTLDVTGGPGTTATWTPTPTGQTTSEAWISFPLVMKRYPKPTDTPTPTSTPTAIPTATETPTPTATPGLSGHIAFASNRNGNLEIYTMRADGSGLARLTHNSASDYEPAWSPDGQYIAFDSDRDENREIYVMKADGTEQTHLTDPPNGDWHPAWSSDGQHIAFYTSRNSVSAFNLEIYVMNADGTQQTRLTYTDFAVDIDPDWSPDGQHIAFVSDRHGDFEIYVMNANGSNQTRLTDFPASSPAWSPDGQLIAFSSSRDGDSEIYVMRADGSQVTRLTDNPAQDWSPAWSPDGQHIAFMSDREGDYDIYVMRADGSELTRLTDNPARDMYPDWSPQ